MTQSISINTSNDAYIVIVTNDKQYNVIVEDFDANLSANLANTMAGGISIDNPLGRVLNAGWNSPIARSILSNTSIPNAVIGRITSSISDIIADGKISSMEVWEDAWGSINNTADNVAIDMGFPSFTALSQAINPSNPPLSTENVKKFVESTSNTLKSKLNIGNKKNNQASQVPSPPLPPTKGPTLRGYDVDGLILKIPLCTKDGETWSSNLPSKKTEEGFDLVTSVQNENIQKSFSVIINNQTLQGSDMYDIRDRLFDLWDKKTSFDLYVCDADVRKNRPYKHCMFQNVSLNTEGKNSLIVDLDIVKIPEWQIKVEKTQTKNTKKNDTPSKKVNKSTKKQTKKRVQKKNTENQAKNTKTATMKKGNSQPNTQVKRDSELLRIREHCRVFGMTNADKQKYAQISGGRDLRNDLIKFRGSDGRN